MPDELDDSMHVLRRRAERPKGRRRLEVEADHRAQLSRAYSYAVGQARTHAQLEQIEQLYQQRMAEGPDFTRYRRKSRFGEPPPHRLDRNAIARLRFRFNSMARQSWQGRQAGRHRGLITRTCKDVFAALLFLAERHKVLFPSLLRLAHIAQCSKQSVVASLDMLERLGFITRHRRIKLVDTALGRKAEQTTNGYELHTPAPASWVGRVFAAFGAGSESNKPAATGSESSSTLRAWPEIWDVQGIAQGDAYGEPPKAARF